MSRHTLERALSSIKMARCGILNTVQMSPHPESKELRGLMTLVKKVKDPYHGYRLVYNADLIDDSWEECLEWWLHDEERWRKARMGSLESKD